MILHRIGRDVKRLGDLVSSTVPAPRAARSHSRGEKAHRPARSAGRSPLAAPPRRSRQFAHLRSRRSAVRRAAPATGQKRSAGAPSEPVQMVLGHPLALTLGGAQARCRRMYSVRETMMGDRSPSATSASRRSAVGVIAAIERSSASKQQPRRIREVAAVAAPSSKAVAQALGKRCGEAAQVRRLDRSKRRT